MKYFDHAATTPMCNEAIEAYSEAAKLCFGNESSLHDEGNKAKQLLEASRKIIASSLDEADESVIFTSGGTESNQLSIQTLLKNTSPTKKHIICSSLEHHSIHQSMLQLHELGYEIEFMKHHSNGIVNLEILQKQIKETTAIIILQHVNSEIGIIQPIASVHQLIKDTDILLHVDCVQSYGKLNCKSISKYADSLAISSHKVYGPKGVGAIVFPHIHTLHPHHSAITHEKGYRSGTVNVPGIYSFAMAVNQVKQDYHIQNMRNIILENLHLTEIPFACIEGTNEQQLPHIICLVFPKVQGQYVMMELNKLGYCVSSGSACQSGTKEPSKALLALGKDSDEAKSSIRISLGAHNTEEQCHSLAHDLSQIITML
ncbi:IscS subfamily cysteine desulfurase [Bacillus massiliigorillae]|uniref:IscS subfamily cysteine desulfurase n=1 Tax=Bacillus massiliigorillae TaxID=1243664 RepID=UPI0003A99AD3|nr:IscS subfamily cysteine desulfurase [Bacillus massiliigorillae]